MDKYRRVEPLSVLSLFEHILKGGNLFQRCGDGKWKFLHNTWVKNLPITVIHNMMCRKVILCAVENPRQIPDDEGGL